MISRSLWHIDKDNSELRTESLNITDSNFIQIRSEYSMISTGTEYSVSTGLVDDDFKLKMSVPYMGGHFSFPIKYGYACSGSDLEGNLYHFMHPHQDICLIQKGDLFKIDSLPSHKVPLISNMETVINAIWDSDLNESDDIAIIGYGNIGSLLAETLSIVYNISPIIVEHDPWRSQKAEENGFKSVDRVNDESLNVIFNTTASNSAMNSALLSLKEEGKLVELSWYADKEVTLNLGRQFHYNRLKIISSQVSKIPIKKRGHMTYEKRKMLAVDFLENERYDKLITDIIDFEEAPTFFNDLRAKKLNEGLIYLFKY